MRQQNSKPNLSESRTRTKAPSNFQSDGPDVLEKAVGIDQTMQSFAEWTSRARQIMSQFFSPSQVGPN